MKLRHCPVLQRKWITELLSLSCWHSTVYPDRDTTMRVCMAVLCSTSLFPLITTMWTGKSTYFPDCPITVATTLNGVRFYFQDWVASYRSKFILKKKSFWNNGNIFLRKVQNWLNLAFPRFEAPDKCSTFLWAQEFNSLPVELLEALKYPSLERMGNCHSGLGWLRTAALGNLMLRSQGYLEILKFAMQVCFPWASSEYTETNTSVEKKNWSQDQTYCFRKPLVLHNS